MSFGNVLIKQVVDDLRRGVSSVRTFGDALTNPWVPLRLAERATTAPESISPALARLVAKGDDIAAADIAAVPGALREE